jgi:hypothetical protein
MPRDTVWVRASHHSTQTVAAEHMHFRLFALPASYADALLLNILP